jgi:hypothetical protein
MVRCILVRVMLLITPSFSGLFITKVQVVELERGFAFANPLMSTVTVLSLPYCFPREIDISRCRTIRNRERQLSSHTQRQKNHCMKCGHFSVRIEEAACDVLQVAHCSMQAQKKVVRTI